MWQLTGWEWVYIQVPVHLPLLLLHSSISATCISFSHHCPHDQNSGPTLNSRFWFSTTSYWGGTELRGRIGLRQRTQISRCMVATCRWEANNGDTITNVHLYHRPPVGNGSPLRQVPHPLLYPHRPPGSTIIWLQFTPPTRHSNWKGYLLSALKRHWFIVAPENKGCFCSMKVIVFGLQPAQHFKVRWHRSTWSTLPLSSVHTSVGCHHTHVLIIYTKFKGT